MKSDSAKVSGCPDLQMNLFSQKKSSLDGCARGVAWTNWDHQTTWGSVDATVPTHPWPQLSGCWDPHGALLYLFLASG